MKLATRLLFGIGLIACLLTSCATTDPQDDGPDRVAPPPRRESGGGLWEQLRKSRLQKEARVAREREARARIERGRESVPSAIRDKLERWWQDFVNLDPTWIDSKAEWLALDDRYVDLLVENLIIMMVRSYDVGNGVLYKRARDELYALSDHSVPYLVECLAGAHGDDVIRQHCVTVLSLIGAPAVSAIEEAWDRADERGRLFLVRALAKTGAPEAVPHLSRIALSDADFQMRINAIEGLGKSGDPRAAGVLIECLSDDDISVRKFAAGWLGAFRDARAVGPLIDCMMRSEAAAPDNPRELEVAANCRRSLRILTGRRFKTVREWKRWADDRAR